MSTMTMTEEGVRLLAALRAASALVRIPRTLTPTGHEQWFTLEQLAAEKRLPVLTAEWLAVYEREARHLERAGLIKHRTQFARTRYMLTGEGAIELLRLDAAGGVTEMVSAAMDFAQARYNAAVAERDLSAARLAMSVARTDRGRAKPGETLTYAALLDAEVPL
jgi:hypothetical protein